MEHAHQVRETRYDCKQSSGSDRSRNSCDRYNHFCGCRLLPCEVWQARPVEVLVALKPCPVPSFTRQFVSPATTGRLPSELAFAAPNRVGSAAAHPFSRVHCIRVHCSTQQPTHVRAAIDTRCLPAFLQTRQQHHLAEWDPLSRWREA